LVRWKGWRIAVMRGVRIGVGRYWGLG